MNKLTKQLSSEAAEYARRYVEECEAYGYWMEDNEYDIQFQNKLLELFAVECVKVCRSVGEMAAEKNQSSVTSDPSPIFTGMWAGAEKCAEGINVLLHDEGFKK